jgi:nucleotide-binding universal stress UspA family protein
MFKRILVPVDGSDATNVAVEVAMALAKQQKGELRFITVVEETISILERLGRTAELPNPRVIAEAHKEVVRDVTNVANKHGCAADFQVIDGIQAHVGEIIADAAKSWTADIIVMGSHGRRGLSRLALGSVAQVTLQYATVPVLVVPTRAGNMPGA